MPVSRYWNEFPGVEITETELGIPGEGTVRRWKREAPEGYAFALRAPQQLTQDGFKLPANGKKLLDEIAKLGHTVGAQAVVFLAPEGFKATRTARAALKEFIAAIPTRFPPIVFDLPLWKPEQVLAAADKRAVSVAYDPLKQAPCPSSQLAYVRLPGPAGHRSRYDEPAIDRIAEHCRTLESSTTLCVFRNIDMHANASSLRKKLSSRAR